MEPSVGRTVHYVDPGGKGRRAKATGLHRAAVVAEVLDGGPGVGIDSITLCVLSPLGLHFVDRVAQDEDRKVPGTWHWPERVD